MQCSNLLWVAVGNTKFTHPSCLRYRNLWNCSVSMMLQLQVSLFPTLLDVVELYVAVNGVIVVLDTFL